MNKKIQVFVSSTKDDLIEERQAAVQAILNAGHIPAGMEFFEPGKSQMETIYKWIDESDVYMLILGGRYGSIEKESGLSYTELEYRYALSKNMPVLPIVLSSDFLQKKIFSLGLNNVIEQSNPDKYKSFKNEVMDKIDCMVEDCNAIKEFIPTALSIFIRDYNLVGFIRNPQKIFKNIDEIDSYICERIKSAKNCVLDLTWSDYYPNLTYSRPNHHTYLNTQDIFLNIIKEKLNQKISYKHIFTFPYNKKERMQRVTELKNFDTYYCGFFESNNSVKIFPKLHFLIIDDEEVIFASSNYNNYLCSLYNREVVGILTIYFNECWSLCSIIKDYDGIHQDNLNAAMEDFKKK